MEHRSRTINQDDSGASIETEFQLTRPTWPKHPVLLSLWYDPLLEKLPDQILLAPVLKYYSFKKQDSKIL